MTRYKKEGKLHFMTPWNHEVKCRGDTSETSSSCQRDIPISWCHFFLRNKINKQSYKQMRAMSILWREFFKTKGIRGRSWPWANYLLIAITMLISDYSIAQSDVLTGKGFSPNYSSSACGTCGTYFDGTKVTSIVETPCAPYDVLYRAYANVKGTVKQNIRFEIDFDNGTTQTLRYNPLDEAGSDLVATPVVVPITGLKYIGYELKPTVFVAARFDETSAKIKCYYKPKMKIYVDGTLVETIDAPGTNVWFKDDKVNPLMIGGTAKYAADVKLEGGVLYYDVCMGNEQVIENPFEDQSTWNCQVDEYPKEDFKGTVPPINNEKRLTYWEYGLDDGEADAGFLTGIQVSNLAASGFVDAIPTGIAYTVVSNGAFHGPLKEYAHPTTGPSTGADYKFIKIPTTGIGDLGKLFRLRLINQNACGFSSPIEAFIRIVAAPIPVVTEETLCLPDDKRVDITFTDNNPRHPRYDKIIWTTTTAGVAIHNSDKQNATLDLTGVPASEFDDGFMEVEVDVSVQGGTTGCVNVDHGTITVYRKPITDFVANPKQICQNGEVTLQYELNNALPLVAGTRVTVDWGDGKVEDIYTGVGGVPGTTLTKKHLYENPSDAVKLRNIVLTATNGICPESSAPQEIVVYPKPRIIAGTTEACARATVDLDFDLTSKHGTLSYYWEITDPNGLKVRTATTKVSTLRHTFDINGEYSVTGTAVLDGGGCERTSDPVTITIDKPEVPDGTLTNPQQCEVAGVATANLDLGVSTPKRTGSKYSVSWSPGVTDTYTVNGAGDLINDRDGSNSWVITHPYNYTGDGNTPQVKGIVVDAISALGLCTENKVLNFTINPHTVAAFTVPTVNCQGDAIAFVNNSKGFDKKYQWSIKEVTVGGRGPELLPPGEQTKAVPNISTLVGNVEYEAILEVSGPCALKTDTHRFNVERVDAGAAVTEEFCSDTGGADPNDDQVEYTLNLGGVSPQSNGTTYEITWGDGTVKVIRDYAWLDAAGWQMTHSYNVGPNANAFEDYRLKIKVISAAATCESTVTKTIRVYPKTVVNFDSPADANCMDTGDVTFTNNTTGVGLTYQWSIFNRTTATNVVLAPGVVTARDLVYDFTTEGEYDVRLEVISAHGCEVKRKTETIEVVDPNGAFTIDGHNGFFFVDRADASKTDIIFDFTGSSYLATGANLQVDFGNGTKKTLTSADFAAADKYTFNVPGYTGLTRKRHQYPVELAVEKDGCTSLPINKNVTIYRVGTDFSITETDRCNGVYDFTDDSYIHSDFKTDPTADKTVLREWYFETPTSAGWAPQGTGLTSKLIYPNNTGADINVRVKLVLTATIKGGGATGFVGDYVKQVEEIHDVVIPPSPQESTEKVDWDKCPGDSQDLHPVVIGSLIKAPGVSRIDVDIVGRGSGTGGAATDDTGRTLTKAQVDGLLTEKSTGVYTFDSSLSPTLNVKGVFTITFTVRNNPGTPQECNFVRTYTVDVSELNVEDQHYYGCTGLPFTFTPKTTGGNKAGRTHQWDEVTDPSPGDLTAGTPTGVAGKNESFTFTPSVPGDYIVRYTAVDVAGCTASNEFTITVAEDPLPTTNAVQLDANHLVEVNPGIEYNVCGSGVTLNGQHNGGAIVGMQAQWRLHTFPLGTTAPVIPNGANVDVNGLKAGTYVFQFVLTNRIAGVADPGYAPCEHSVLVTVNVFDPITVVNTTAPSVVEETTVVGPTDLQPTVNITGGSGAYTYQWEVTKPDGTPDAVFNASAESRKESPTYSAIGIGTFRFTLHVIDNRGGICEGDSPAIPMEVVDRLPAVAGPNQNVCGKSAGFAADKVIAPNSAGEGTWTQINGPGISDIKPVNSNVAGVTVNVYGTYTYRWTVTSTKSGVTCTEFDEVDITYHAPVTVAFAADDIYFNVGDAPTMNPNVERDGTVLTGGALTAEYDILWTDASGKLGATNIEKPTFDTTVKGDFDLTITISDKAGICTDVSKVVHVHVLEVPVAGANILTATTTVGDPVQEYTGHTLINPKYIVVGKQVQINGFNELVGGIQPDAAPLDHISGEWTVNKPTGYVDRWDIHNPTVKVTDYGTYEFTYTINSGLTPATLRASQITVEVTFVAPIEVNTVGESTFCPSNGELEIGNEFTVTGGSAPITNYTYTVTKDGDPTDFSHLLLDDNAADKNLRFDALHATEGTYKVTLTINDPFNSVSSDNAIRTIHVTKAMLPQIRVMGTTPEVYGTIADVQKAQVFNVAAPEYFIIGKHIQLEGSDDGMAPAGLVNGTWQRFDGTKWVNETVKPLYDYTSTVFGQVRANWRLNNGICQVDLPVLLNFIEPIEIDPIDDFYFCRGDNNAPLNGVVSIKGGSADGITYRWNVVDAGKTDVTATILNASNVKAPQINMTNAVVEGVYTATLTATDNHGSIQVVTETFDIHVLEKPIASITVPDAKASGTAGATVQYKKGTSGASVNLQVITSDNKIKLNGANISALATDPDLVGDLLEGRWNMVSGPDIVAGIVAWTSNSANSTASITNPGTYVFRWSMLNVTPDGDRLCETHKDIEVEFVKGSTARPKGDQEVCQQAGGLFQLQDLIDLAGGSGAFASYNWAAEKRDFNDTPPGVDVTATEIVDGNITDKNASLRLDNEGLYHITLTALDAKGVGGATATFVVAVIPQQNADANGDQETCLNEIQLDANPIVGVPGLTRTGEWSVTPAGAVAFTNVNDPRAKALRLPGTSGNFTLTWTITSSYKGFNCVETDDMQAYFVQPIEIAEFFDGLGANAQVCIGNDLPIRPVISGGSEEATGDYDKYNYTWRMKAAGGFDITNHLVNPATGIAATNLRNLTLRTTDIPPNNYEVILEVNDPISGTCVTTRDFTIEVKEAPVAEAIVQPSASVKTMAADHYFTCETTVDLEGTNIGKVDDGAGTKVNGTGVGFASIKGEWSKASGPGNVVFTVNTPGAPSGKVDPLATAEFDQPGTYEISWTVYNVDKTTCPSTKIITVEVKAPITVTFANPTVYVCEGSPAFDITPIYAGGSEIDYKNFIWTEKGAVVVGAVNAAYTFDPTGKATGVYPLSVTLDDKEGTVCQGAGAVDVVIVEMPTPNIHNTTTEFCGLRGSLTADALMVATRTDKEVGTWRLKDGGAGSDGAVIAMPNLHDVKTDFIVTNKGKYIFEWVIEHQAIDAGGGVAHTCEAVDEITVHMRETPVVNVDPPAHPECDKDADLEAVITGDYQSVLWELKSGPSGTATANFTPADNRITSVDVNEYGNYTFKVTVENGVCTPQVVEVTYTFLSQPNADFTINTDLEGCSPLDVGVTNTSTGDELKKYRYQWKEVDPADPTDVRVLSYDENPATDFVIRHMGNRAKDRNIVLVVSNGYCESTAAPIAVNVHPMPLIDFSYTQDGNCSPVEATLTNKSQFSDSYSWDFNEDGVEDANDENPVHSFTNTDFTKFNFKIKLTGTKTTPNLAGTKDYVCTNDQEQIIAVAPKPTFSLSSNIPAGGACSPEEVAFVASPGAIDYTWNFGDKTPEQVTHYVSMVDHEFSHMEPTAQNYVVKVDAIFPGGCKASETANIEIHPEMKATFTAGKTTICSGETVVFDNLSTPGADSYTWIVNGVEELVQNRFEPTFTHTFISASFGQVPMNVTLKVKGAKCEDISTQVINVNPKAKADFDFAAGKDTFCSGEQVVFANKTIGGKTFSWDYGDGTAPDDKGYHPYTNHGPADATHTITLTADNDFGCSSTVTKNVNIIHEMVPGWTFNIKEGCSPLEVEITNTTTGGEDATIDFGDGTTATLAGGASVTHTFTNTEVSETLYNVSMKVAANAAGLCDKTLRDVIRVYPVINADFSFAGDKTTYCSDEIMILNNTTVGFTEYKWDYGDGTKAKDSYHTYSNKTTKDITQTVRLDVENFFGCTDFIEKDITVIRDVEPKMKVVTDGTCSPVKVTITNLTSGANTMFIDFRDGTPPMDVSAMKPGETVERIFTNDSKRIDKYDITLTVSPGGGCSKTINQMVEVRPSVTADFDLSAGGCSPVTATVTDKSVGADSWSWDFGVPTDPKATTTIPSPSYHYVNTTNVPIEYTVTLTARSSFGCTATAVPKKITVNPQPNVSFDMTPRVGCAPFTAHFTNASSGVDTFTWYIDDGMTITETAATYKKEFDHIYNNKDNFDRSFSVRLVGENAYGCKQEPDPINMIVHPEVSADFDMDVGMICSPVDVQFDARAKSIGGDTYQWNFGDGSDIQYDGAPLKTFENDTDAPKSFDITLTVSTRFCDSQMTKKLEIQPHMEGKFVVDKMEGCSPLEVSFKNTSINCIDYLWSFDDGKTTENIPDLEFTRTFVHDSKKGKFKDARTVSLFASNRYCKEKKPAKEQIVIFAPAKAGFELSGDGHCSPAKVNFISTADHNYNVTWDFGDGSTSIADNPEHLFLNEEATDKIYTIKQTVASNQGCTDDMTKTYKVNPTPKVDFGITPVFMIWPEATVSVSNITNEGPWKYKWSFGEHDGVTIDKKDPDPYTYGRVGTFKIKLEATGEECSNSYEETVTIRPGVPVANFTPSVVEGCSPLTVTFKNSSKNASTYYWEFDGVGASHDREPTRTFTEEKYYNVRLTVRNEEGTADVMEKTIHVLPVPKAYFTVLPSRVEIPGQKAIFSNLSVNNYENYWDFGDGTKSTEVDPSHEYVAQGVHDVTLRVVSEDGCEASFEQKAAVTAVSNGRVKVPNVFTPSTNGPTGGTVTPGESDVYNRTFLPIVPSGEAKVSSYDLKVFNRWGNMVFHSRDINTGWDGYYNGKLAPLDVYMWQINVSFDDGNTVIQAGDVTLIR
ncbi:gliding motility-associated C-terminal domain-containing protein [Halosquirtibacter xylanolyticus]|uniref:PKD domain-containing protein n=1 Tax=Halosquirtibacter xylanolyticus TaxID=3374599 RepID=UPI003748EBC3|nr:gliding motility-associated C-terminal domain-containing protein [Prolixibacteraceae bacterium]